jgi:hypothetical protein
MFGQTIKTKKVRNNLFAYQYINGAIEIEGVKYCYSLSEAIKKHVKKYPKHKQTKN